MCKLYNSSKRHLSQIMPNQTDLTDFITYIKESSQARKILYCGSKLTDTKISILFLYDKAYFILDSVLESGRPSFDSRSSLTQIRNTLQESGVVICGYDILVDDFPLFKRIEDGLLYTPTFNLWDTPFTKSKWVKTQSYLSVARALEEANQAVFYYKGSLIITFDQFLMESGHLPVYKEKSLLDYCVKLQQTTHDAVCQWIDTRSLFSSVFPELVLRDIMPLTRASLAESVIRLRNPSLIYDTSIARTVTWADLCFLHDYKYLPLYKDYLSDLNNIEEGISSKVIDIPACGKITLGLGGLHCVYANNVLYTESDSHTLFEIDVTSFYPILMLHILKAGKLTLGNNELSSDLESFIQTRIKLKQEQKPEAIVYKIILNAMVGSANFKKSVLYQPELNYSVTLNGQLMMLDLINKLQDCIDLCIYVNTDGAIVKLLKDNVPALLEILSQFEREYKIQFGTKRKLSAFAVANVNHYLSITHESNKVSTKGFGREEAPIIKDVLKHMLQHSVNPEKGRSPQAAMPRRVWSFQELLNLVTEKLEAIKNLQSESVSTLCRHFMYIKRIGNPSRVVQYYWSCDPQYFKGLVIPNKSKVNPDGNITLSKSRPFSVCEVNPSHVVSDVCVKSYTYLIWKAATNFGLNVSPLTLF